MSALSAVAKLADARAGQLIVEALLDRDPGVVRVAQELHERLATYFEGKAMWDQAVASGGELLSPLAALLKQASDPSKDVRLLAIRSLGAFGKPEVLPHLIEIARDPDPQIQAAARESIEKLLKVEAAGKGE